MELLDVIGLLRGVQAVGAGRHYHKNVIRQFFICFVLTPRVSVNYSLVIKTAHGAPQQRVTPAMPKILDRFASAPTATNAQRVLVYLAKHPMAECLLTAAELSLVARAKQMAGG